MKVVKNRCGGKKSGCSVKKTDKKLYEFPFFVEDSLKKAA